MTKILLFAIFICYSFVSIAQNTVSLQINHKVNNTGLTQTSNVGTNNLGDQFDISHLFYYVSEISLTHDGGQVTPINDTWLLVDGFENGNFDLGSHNITALEKITFHIGVDQAHNHLDPSTYRPDHPLAPQNPSMHWGWTSGYRFVVLEGSAGNNLNQIYGLHGLDDSNYFSIELNINATANNGQLIIPVDADYARALENINVASGVTSHGGGDEAKVCLENFRDYVFSPGNVTSIDNFNHSSIAKIYPNPTSNNLINVDLNTSEVFNFDVKIYNVLGSLVAEQNNLPSTRKSSINFSQRGVYLLRFVKDGKPFMTKKVTVL